MDEQIALSLKREVVFFFSAKAGRIIMKNVRVDYRKSDTLDAGEDDERNIVGCRVNQ